MEIRNRELSGDRNGGIEGLPLQLMIMILVATMGTAIIIGWMGSIETPHSIGEIDVEPDDVCAVDGAFGFTVYVGDQDGNPLEGATVFVTNSNVHDVDGRTPVAITDVHGKATFIGLTMERHDNIGFVDISISKPGYGEKDNIRIVVRF